MTLYAPAVEPFTANTGQFTQTHFSGDPSGTLTISGGVGTYVYTGSSFSSAFFIDTNFPCVDQKPSIFVSVDIVSIPVNPAGSYVSLDPGIYKDGGNALFAEFGTNYSTGSGGYFNLIEIVSGVKSYLTQTIVNVTDPTTAIPQAVGMSLNGNTIYMWHKYSGSWELVAYATTSKNYTAAGALAGYCAGFSVWTNNPGGATVEVTNLQFGLGWNPGSYYQAVVLGDTPVSFVPGNEPATLAQTAITDIINGHLNGAFAASPTLGVTAPAALGGSAIQAPGTSNASIYFLNPFDPGPPNPTSISMEFWVKSAGGTTGGGTGMAGACAGLFSDVSGVVPTDWGLNIYGSIGVSVGWGSPSGDQQLVSSTALNDGNWHHVVGLLNVATGAASIYIDGALNCSGTGATGPGRVGNTYWWWGANANNLPATSCNWALYNYLLTPTQILNHYQAGAVYSFTAPLLLGGTATGLNATLTWQPPASGGTPYGYTLYRNGTFLADIVGDPGYNDTLPGSGSYVYTVACWNGTSVVSPQSAPATVTVSSSVTVQCYGKFVPAGPVSKPILLADASGIKPRIWMPAENTTVERP